MRINNLTRRCGHVLAFCLMLQSPSASTEESKVENLLLFDLNSDERGLQWYVQNDTVMGGRSQGGFSITDKALIFSGVTNTNGGGLVLSAPKKLQETFQVIQVLKSVSSQMAADIRGQYKQTLDGEED